MLMLLRKETSNHKDKKQTNHWLVLLGSAAIVIIIGNHSSFDDWRIRMGPATLLAVSSHGYPTNYNTDVINIISCTVFLHVGATKG
jgi:hypothetical protein